MRVEGTPIKVDNQSSRLESTTRGREAMVMALSSQANSSGDPAERASLETAGRLLKLLPGEFTVGTFVRVMRMAVASGEPLRFSERR